MRRGIWLLVAGVLATTCGVASARGDGTDTTTTTTAAAAYGPLPSSYLPTACVGAGDAAIATPSGQPLALGTPASVAGASAYPTSSPVVAFGSSAVSGSGCAGTHVALASVSLFGGFVTASSVTAMNGRGTVSGLVIDGSPVAIGPGQSALLGYWGQLTLGKTVGRLRAPLVVLLLKRYWNLPAGTNVLVGFTASALPVHTATTQRSSETPKRTSTTPTAALQQAAQSGRAAASKSHAKRPNASPPPDFPATADPVLADGELTDVARHNPVVSIAMQYLGVRYQWGGASPQSGFDCSGLVQYVFGRLGVSLPHYTASQWYSPAGVWVRPSRLRPGDLVFFTGSDGTRRNPGHVGIYVGDGYLIDAPHTGSFVRIDSLDDGWFANQYVGATRIVGAADARHLLDRAKPGASTAAVPPRLMDPFASDPFGDSPVVAAAGATAVRLPWHYWWSGFGLGGVLLLLAGAVTYRMRQRKT